jgi:phosphotransferase family enzyme
VGREVFGRVSGLLDFETAVTGDCANEFAGASLLVPSGDPRLLGRMLAGYGRGFDPWDLLARKPKSFARRTARPPCSFRSWPPRNAAV